MKRGALYVEIDKFAAAWLRELIAWGLIAPGDVHEGSFEDLTPADLDRYVQVHLCAGIGVWSHALRRAGWPDDREVWTASFPCQPFSAAGKGGGFADERHLWPTGHWLIEQCRPVVLLGEQVASKPGLEWFDLVSTDLEGSGYTVGAHDLCAAGVGAPHIRQRLYFVGLQHAESDGRIERRPESERRCVAGGGGTTLVNAAGQQARLPGRTREPGGSVADGGGARLEGCDPRTLGHECASVERSGCTGLLADDDSGGPCPGRRDDGQVRGLQEAQRQPEHSALVPGRGGRLVGFVADTDGRDTSAEGLQRSRQHGQQQENSWADPDWIPCRDGKWRPVEPGTFPLAHGAAARVGRLRGYGNALVAPVAQAFIEAVMTCL